MHADIVALQAFYQASLGQVARRMVLRALREVWSNTAGLTVAGVGYAIPYLRPFRGEAARVLALMPAQQGVAPWPSEGPGLSCLCDDASLPLPDLSVDRVLLIHGLEGTEHPRPLLREIWRVLAGNGRLLVVAPNRRGLWARADGTPFGHGHPYSAGQLARALTDALFVPLRQTSALFVPPVQSRLALSWAPAWEKLGRRWFPGFGGVTMIEAGKQMFAGVTSVEPVAKKSLIMPLPNGVTQWHHEPHDQRPNP
ncbi:Methyltransferase type 11 [uncultured Gammaproteobacteria bacterium]